jgi:hypothetical protein
VLGDLRWGGMYGCEADFVASENCKICYIYANDFKVGVLWTSELWAVRSSQGSSKWLHVLCWLTARDFLIFRFSVSAKPIITIGPQILARFDIFVQDGRAR